MIISHKYKFIFLKTNKTAGTSIEIALSEYCGADDIITPISPEDEKLRKRIGYRRPQNYLCPLASYGAKDYQNYLLKGKRKKKFYNHISAQKVKERIGNQIWDDYFKFCFERNPWDRVISLYFYKRRSEPRMPISEFIASPSILKLKRKGYHLYTIDGDIAVDKVCRYENLTQELETVRKRVGIPKKLLLPKTKTKYRSGNKDYRTFFNETDKEKIAKIFHEEICLLGYEF